MPASGTTAKPIAVRGRRCGAWRTDRRGTVALEFGLIALPFFMVFLGVFEVGYDFFVAAVLDNALHVAARSVQVGAIEGSVTKTAEQQWVISNVCPALGGLLNCNYLYVNIVGVPSGVGQNYYTYISANPPSITTITSSSDTVCTGSGGQLMLLQAYYLGPTFLGLIVPGWAQASPLNSSTLVHVTYVSTGFINEYFGPGESGC